MIVQAVLEQQGVLAAIDQIGVTVPDHTGGLEAVSKKGDDVFTLLDALRVACLRKELAFSLCNTTMLSTLTPETGYPSQSILYGNPSSQSGPYSEEVPALFGRRPEVIGALFMQVTDDVVRPALLVVESGRSRSSPACKLSLTCLVNNVPFVAMESERFDRLDVADEFECGLFGESTETNRRASSAACAKFMADRLVREPLLVPVALRIDETPLCDVTKQSERSLYYRHEGVAPFLRLRPACTTSEEEELARAVADALQSEVVSDARLISCATPDGDVTEHSAARGFSSAVAATHYKSDGLVVSTIFCGSAWHTLSAEAHSLRRSFHGNSSAPSAVPLSDNALTVRHRIATTCARRATGIATSAEVAAMLLFWGPTSTLAALRSLHKHTDEVAPRDASHNDEGEGVGVHNYQEDDLVERTKEQDSDECMYPADEMDEVIGAMTLHDAKAQADVDVVAPAENSTTPLEAPRISLSIGSSSDQGVAAAKRPMVEGAIEATCAFVHAVKVARSSIIDAAWLANSLIVPSVTDDLASMTRCLYSSMFNGLAYALGLIKQPVTNVPIPARAFDDQTLNLVPSGVDRVEAGACILLAEQLAAHTSSTCAPDGRVLLVIASGKVASWAPPWRPGAASVAGYLYAHCRCPGEAATLEVLAAKDDRALRIYRRLDVCTFVVEAGAEIGRQCHHISWRLVTNPELWLKQTTVSRQLSANMEAPNHSCKLPESVCTAGTAATELPPEWIAAVVRQTLAHVAVTRTVEDVEGDEWLARTTGRLYEAQNILLNVMDSKRRRLETHA